MIVLDTTVLVYAVGVEHPLREPCRRLIAAVDSGALRATTTVEVLQEFVHVRARRRDRSGAARLGDAYAELLAPLLPVGIDDLRGGLTLFEVTAGLGCSDAVLASAAVASGADALVSADRAFGSVPQLRHVFPDETGVRALVAD